MIDSSLHDWLDFGKGVSWPLLILVCVISYSREVRSVLRAVGSFLKRIKSAKAFGFELEAETKKLEGDVKRAEPEAITTVVRSAEVFDQRRED
jgi:hypothetical protein